MPEAEDINLGRQDREDMRGRIASLALAGLQRPIYAGVFHPLPKRKHPAWTCDLPLDGYNRHLNITFCRKPVRTPARDTELCYRGRMTGLRPFFQRRDFELLPPAGDALGRRLIGRIDLHIAVLKVSVLPCRGADDHRLMIGLLEVQRRSPEDGK